MRKIYETSTSETYKTDNGVIIGIDKDNSLKNYYTVFIKEPKKKGYVAATRCTYEKAMVIVHKFEE